MISEDGWRRSASIAGLHYCAPVLGEALAAESRYKGNVAVRRGPVL